MQNIFKKDKINFIGYIATLVFAGIYLNTLKQENPNAAYNLFIFTYVFMIGFIYNGVQFVKSNQSYIDEYYERKKDTFKYLYFDYTNVPQHELELYYSLKTILLALPAILFLL